MTEHDRKASGDRAVGLDRLRSLGARVHDRLRPSTPVQPPFGVVPALRDQVTRLSARVAVLEEAVEENRRLNQRLADVVDVVTEVLVPAVDRDDERLQRALGDLTRTLDDDPDHD